MNWLVKVWLLKNTTACIHLKMAKKHGYLSNYVVQMALWFLQQTMYVHIANKSVPIYFGVDAAHIVVATLKKLADEGEVDARLVKDAISSFELDVDRPVAWLPQAHPTTQDVAPYAEPTEEK